MFVRGQRLKVTGPDGKRHSALLLTVHQSTGGVFTLWLDLSDDYLANPANRGAKEWFSTVLVLTEKDGAYLDLWLEPWVLEVAENG